MCILNYLVVRLATVFLNSFSLVSLFEFYSLRSATTPLPTRIARFKRYVFAHFIKFIFHWTRDDAVELLSKPHAQNRDRIHPAGCERIINICARGGLV